MFGIYYVGAVVIEQWCMLVMLVVNFVEGYLVFDFVFIVFKYYFCEMYKEINYFMVGLVIVLLYQMQRYFKVGEGDYWFDVVFQQFIEYIIVEFQFFFVWLSFIVFWKNVCLGNGCMKIFEVYFGKQFDVFFIVIIKINGFMVWIVFFW